MIPLADHIRSSGASSWRAAAGVALVVACGLLSACAASGGSDALKGSVETLAETQRVVDRTFREPFETKETVVLSTGKGTLGPAARPVDTAALAPVLERFSSSRRQKTGTYVVAGADLTRDGKTRALVLFTSENWCQPQGCDLAIFEQGAFGWRAVATISRVKAPIRLGPGISNGWHDLWVMTGRGESTGGSKSFVQNVRLQYGANGYPGTTTFALSDTVSTPEGPIILAAADLDLPDKTRFATGGRNPEHNKKKLKALTPVPTVKPTPRPVP